MLETPAHSEQSLALTATDLKQWAYCKRIVYYRHVMPVEFSRTYKMQRGRNVEAAVEAMEKRRGFRRYGLEGGERRFGAWVTSKRLGLAGKLDLLIVTDSACYPVDFKDTEGGVRRNHRIQLTAYALMIEESLGRSAPAAFVYLVPSKELTRIEIGDDLRKEVIGAIDEIRSFVRDERIPEPTSARARCVGCEFQNYCDDIW